MVTSLEFYFLLVLNRRFSSRHSTVYPLTSLLHILLAYRPSRAELNEKEREGEKSEP